MAYLYGYFGICFSNFQAHPAIKTLVSVYEGFRVTKKVDQMADAFFEVAEILNYPHAEMFEDMMRISLIIMVIGFKKNFFSLFFG